VIPETKEYYLSYDTLLVPIDVIYLRAELILYRRDQAASHCARVQH